MSEIKHTPTPWRVWQDGNGRLHVGPSSNCYVAALNHPPTGMMQANAYFIIEAVNTLEDLTAERDRLREENETFRRIMKSIKTYGELACVDVDRGSLRPSGKKPATKEVWQFPRHMLDEVDAAISKATT